jgi:DNA-directed RNA polymerase subunit L
MTDPMLRIQRAIVHLSIAQVEIEYYSGLKLAENIQRALAEIYKAVDALLDREVDE